MKNGKDVMIALLVERLGGEVKVTATDWRRAAELELTEWEDLPGNGMRYTAKRPPEILIGEVVGAEPKRTDQ